MNTVFGVGALLTVAGVVGYITGTVVVYPGRSLSLTALMAGVTMLAIGRSAVAEDNA